MPGVSTETALDTAAASRICRAAFTDHAARLQLPSLSWGLVRGGVVVAGESTQAIYRVASMTKSFTSAVALSLRDEGVLGLDDPVHAHAPELNGLRCPMPGSPPITVRHLLSMSSGLATDDAWADRHLDLTDAELDSIVAAGLTFAATTGTTFEYSNLGFAVLGRIVRNATGSTVQELVSARLLGPLEMTRTSWIAPADAMPGYRERDGDEDPLIVEPSLDDGVMAPMGGLFSCVADLARWVDFLSAAFDPDRASIHDAILAASSRREMQQVARAFAADYDTSTGEWSQRPGGYGFGLNVLPHARLATVVTHSGGLPGFGSNMRWVPATGVGLVALANSTYAPMSATTSTVLDLLADSGAVSRPRPPVTDAIAAAARRLIDQLAGWDDGVADLFADNIDLDEPLAARRDAAAELVADHGPLTMARVVAESATSAVAVVHGNGVELRVDFQLTPTNPPLIQSYEVTVVD